MDSERCAYLCYHHNSINADSFLEYHKANEELGEFTDEHPFFSYSRRTTPAFNMITRVLGDLPMVYTDFITSMIIRH